MTTQLKNFLNASLLVAAICFAGCTGKDGDPGPAGTNGTNGTNGTDGAGFDEAVQYGNIKVTFSGKRPLDGVTFNSVQDFKFSPVGNNPYDYSSVGTDSETEELYFEVKRFLSGVDEHYNDNYYRIELDVTKDGVIDYFYLSAYTSIVDGTKFFGISESVDAYSTDEAPPATITEYSFDKATGHLKFKFNWVDPTSYSTGNDLTMSGVVDVFVLEGLNDVNNGEG